MTLPSLVWKLRGSCWWWEPPSDFASDGGSGSTCRPTARSYSMRSHRLLGSSTSLGRNRGNCSRGLQKTTSAIKDFRFGACKPIAVGHAPVTAFRITYVGELGYELYIPVDFAGHVYETLWEAGQDFSIGNAGYRAINSMRLEKGNADWGSELTPEYTPYDAGLDTCVFLDKEDFMGKVALARIRKDGAPWRLCSFTLDEKDPVMIQGSAPIIRKGEVIGVTSSAGYGHTIEKTIAYGYVPAEKAVSGQGWEIESYRKVYPATCHLNRILYDPQREKIRV